MIVFNMPHFLGVEMGNAFLILSRYGYSAYSRKKKNTCDSLAVA